MIEMSSGIGATAMGIGVSHGTGGGEGVASGCRLRAQSQGQASGSSGNPQQSSQQQQQQQQQPPSCQQPQQQQQRQPTGIMGRSKKDNCCLCWCCCCSCSNKCLAAVGGNTAGAGGVGEQGKKKGNAGIGGELGSGVGVGDVGAAGNGLDAMDGLDGNVECTLEEIRSWGSSFEQLMRSPAGRKFFREFLVSEYSEENIAFWLACEDLKCEHNPEKIEENARYIYDRYISTVSEKEVSLDSQVREIVNRNMLQPTPHTFDEAQLQIYTLMSRDSYPRFVNSEMYRRVARLGRGTVSSSNQEQHAAGTSKGKKGTT